MTVIMGDAVAVRAMPIVVGGVALRAVGGGIPAYAGMTVMGATPLRLPTAVPSPTHVCGVLSPYRDLCIT